MSPIDNQPLNVLEAAPRYNIMVLLCCSVLDQCYAFYTKQKGIKISLKL